MPSSTDMDGIVTEKFRSSLLEDQEEVKPLDDDGVDPYQLEDDYNNNDDGNLGMVDDPEKSAFVALADSPNKQRNNLYDLNYLTQNDGD